MDLVFDVERLPKDGETLKAKNFIMTSGGKGANQAVACKKQGIDTFIIGSIGTDALSKKNKENLLLHGINCEYLEEVSGETSGIAGIILEKGDNRIITYSGANKFQDKDKINRIINSKMNSNDYLLAQLEIPIDIVESAFKEAKKKGVTTVLNAAPITKLSKELLKSIDILIVNETEFQQLTKIYLNDEIIIKESAKKLLDLGIEKVLLTLGEKGSILISKDSYIKVPAYKVKVVDTTAAGDTFIGAYLSNLIRYNDDLKAVKYATAASALTVQTLGAQVSIPSKNETENFIKEMGEIYD
jgi:ribokinase